MRTFNNWWESFSSYKSKQHRLIVLESPYLFQEESTLYLHINNICKIILCIVLKVKIKQSPCFYRKNKGNCYSLILFSVLRSFAKIRIFFIHPYTFVMQNLWIFCICTLICITLCFICSDSYVM